MVCRTQAAAPQIEAERLVDTFAGTIDGVRGTVALFNRSSRALEHNPEATKTFTRTLDQVRDAITCREESKLRRADLVALELVELRKAEAALTPGARP